MPSGHGSTLAVKTFGRYHAAAMRLWTASPCDRQTHAGDSEHCRMTDDDPPNNDPGVANARDSSDARGAHGDGPNRGALSPFPSRAPTHSAALGLSTTVL